MPFSVSIRSEGITTLAINGENVLALLRARPEQRLVTKFSSRQLDSRKGKITTFGQAVFLGKSLAPGEADIYDFGCPNCSPRKGLLADN